LGSRIENRSKVRSSSWNFTYLASCVAVIREYFVGIDLGLMQIASRLTCISHRHLYARKERSNNVTSDIRISANSIEEKRTTKLTGYVMTNLIRHEVALSRIVHFFFDKSSGYEIDKSTVWIGQVAACTRHKSQESG
jgi:hypothetical protein